MTSYDYLIIPLVLGSYGFTWVVYVTLTKKLDELLTNHIRHNRETLEKLEKKVDLFIEAYYRSRRSQ